MKKIPKEEIVAMLEKAAAEIEARDAEIARLQEELEELKKQATTATMINKEASESPIPQDYFSPEEWGVANLGAPADVQQAPQNAKQKLEEFLASLA